MPYQVDLSLPLLVDVVANMPYLVALFLPLLVDFVIVICHGIFANPGRSICAISGRCISANCDRYSNCPTYTVDLYRIS